MVNQHESPKQLFESFFIESLPVALRGEERRDG